MLTAIKEKTEVLEGGLIKLHTKGLPEHSKVTVSAIIETVYKPRSKKISMIISSAKGVYGSPKELIAHSNKERLGKSKIRTLGAYKGRIKMSNDFDQPLPESYWTGKSNTFCHS